MKKFLALLLVLVIGIGAGVGGTVAYLTDNDSDVNVMTVGNVSIEQHEYERVVENGEYQKDTFDGKESYVLKDFTQAKPLLPATELGTDGKPYNYGAGGWDATRVKMTQVDSYGYMDVFVSKDAQDKFVTVENTGKTDAYVRTIVAFELGEVDIDNFGNIIRTSSRSTKDEANFDQPWLKKDIGRVVIDGNNYVVVEYVYHGADIGGGSYRHENGVLPAGDTTYPSLCQVYMTAAATNEDVKAIDGNGNGTYDILVLSQAVQVANFPDAETALNAAFPKGEKNANVAKWFFDVLYTSVGTAEELTKALANGESVVLTEDVTAPLTNSAIYGTPVAAIQKGGIIDGGGNSLDIENPQYNGYAIETYGGTIKNLTIDTTVGRGIVISFPEEDVYIDNVVVDGPGYAINTTEHNGKNLYVTNSTVKGWTSLAGLDSVSFTNCEFGENTSKYWQNMGYDQDYDRLVRPYVDAEFKDCKFEQDYYIDLSALGADCTVTLDNCTVGGVVLTADNYDDYITVELPSGRTLADCVIFK